MSFPLTLETAFHDQDQIADGRTNGYAGTDFEHTRHARRRPDTLVRMLRQRRRIMSHQDAPIVGGPLEDRRVVGAREANVLDSNDVDSWYPAQEATEISLLKFSSAATRSTTSS